MNTVHNVLISLGSNHNADANMAMAQTSMREKFSDIEFSRILSTEPIGIGGPNFLNCLCRLHTPYSLERLQLITKQMELELGDSKQQRQQGHVSIDIDILSYDDQRLHVSDWQRPYIATLLADF